MTFLEILGLRGMTLKLTKREWLVMTSVCVVCFTSGTCFSLQGPIYPQEASSKGVSAWQYGMVLGVFELVNFVVCPVYGKYMDILGTRFLLIAGTILAGVSTILFGFLHEINIKDGFLSLSFVLRIMEALGSSAAFTASFSLSALTFKKTVATAFAIAECAFGLGFSLGPALGGYLYDVGGFLYPFLIIGSLMVVVGVILIFVLPNVEDSDQTTKEKGQIWPVLSLIPVIMDLLSTFSIHFSAGFFFATLEPHLREFNLSSSNVGAFFALDGGIYMVTTPLVGRICDTSLNPKSIMIVGSLVAITSVSLIGPLPFLPIPTTLWMVYLGMALHGFAIACIMVPSFIDAIQTAVKHGLPDNLTTYGLVTGLSSSAVALGAFVGPVIAGIMFDTVGFRYGTLVIIAIFLLVFLLMLWFVCKEWSTKDDRSQKGLISSTSEATLTSSSKWIYGSTADTDVIGIHQSQGDTTNHNLGANEMPATNNVGSTNEEEGDRGTDQSQGKFNAVIGGERRTITNSVTSTNGEGTDASFDQSHGDPINNGTKSEEMDGTITIKTIVTEEKSITDN